MGIVLRQLTHLQAVSCAGLARGGVVRAGVARQGCMAEHRLRDLQESCLDKAFQISSDIDQSHRLWRHLSLVESGWRDLHEQLTADAGKVMRVGSLGQGSRAEEELKDLQERCLDRAFHISMDRNEYRASERHEMQAEQEEVMHERLELENPEVYSFSSSEVHMQEFPICIGHPIMKVFTDTACTFC